MSVTYIRRTIPLLTAVALLWLLLAGVAQAQSPLSTTLEFTVPAEGAVGQEMTLSARLTDQTGVAVADAEVVFMREAHFFNSVSEVVIGRAVTNGQGMASLPYLPRSEGEIAVFAEFQGTPLYGSDFVSGAVFVQTGPPLYHEEAGVKLRGLNISLPVGILATIWSAYFVVMTLIFLIAREGAASPTSEVSHE